MKFICTVDIKLPVERVIQLFDNVDNLKHWQDGFQRFEHISGVPGETDAKSRIRYKTGKRDLEFIETIITRNLPDEFTALYEAKPMINTMNNRFNPLSENRTRHEAEIKYTEFNGFMVKMMSTLFPGIFKKKVQKWLNQFKAFCEESGLENKMS